MSAEKDKGGEEFLSRWSRLKREAREEPAVPPPPPTAPTVDAKAAPPDLPPIEELTIDSDFRGFFHPKVNEDLRRTALRKLFSDPHFNVMDGLDVYIDDYSKSDPLPTVMLAQLKQAQKIIEWAQEKKEDAKEDAAANATVSPAVAEAPPTLADPAASSPAASGQSEPAVEKVAALPEDAAHPGRGTQTDGKFGVR